MHTPLRLDAYLCRPSFTASWCVSPVDTSRTVKIVKFLLTKELMISEIISFLNIFKTLVQRFHVLFSHYLFSVIVNKNKCYVNILF